MKKLLLLLLAIPTLALAQKTPQGVTYDAKIIRVNDGDTVVIAAPFLPAPLKPELAVRVFGVDTPEKDTEHCAQVKHSEEKPLPLSLKMQWHLHNVTKSSYMVGISLVVGY